MPLLTFFYVTKKLDDGKADVQFFADRECAQIAWEVEMKNPNGFRNKGPQEIELEFDDNGKLLTPDFTKGELVLQLAEMISNPPAVKPSTPVAQEFTHVASPSIVPSQTPVPARDTLQNIDVRGKMVAFGGRLSMNRVRMKDEARQLGVQLASAVTESTDILVVGEDPGMKLERAQEFGTLVITEAQWNEIVRRSQERKPAPSP